MAFWGLLFANMSSFDFVVFFLLSILPDSGSDGPQSTITRNTPVENKNFIEILSVLS